MSRLPRRVHAREYMDAPHVDAAMLEASLDDVAGVNRWLGGTRAVRIALDELLAGRTTATVLDVGCGAADIPIALARHARRAGRRLRFVAVDGHAATIAIARRRTRAHREISVLRADALSLPFATGAFDAALLSLTLHHLEPDALVPVLRELLRVARLGIVVNELHRALPNYLGARLLAATLWRRRAITRHDGPLSVLRAFTPAELRALAYAAGITSARVDRRFFYRVVLVGEPPNRSATAHTA